MPTSIIHIFNDDKFIDPSIKLFEEVIPNQSVYFIIKRSDVSLHYVKSTNVKKIDLSLHQEKKELLDFINSKLNHVVFFHALDKDKQNLVIEILPIIKKVWFIWGYDLYSNWSLLKKDIYQSKTKSFLKIKSNFKYKILNSWFAFLLFQNSKLIRKVNLKSYKILDNTFNTKFYQSVQLIDFVVPVVPTEFSLVKKINSKVKYAPFTYGCLEDLLDDKLDKNVKNQPNILVGNSADPSNNHVEVFLKLSKLDLKDRIVYVPLSYGGNENYKNHVLNAGRELLGVNFHPLIDFMPLEKYNQILLSCGTLIFNHIRQQGVGNIIISGYLGATLFLNKKSPVYKYYKSIGIEVFSTSQVSKKSFNPLNERFATQNRDILYSLYSRKAVHEKIKTLIQIIDK
ncbi:TDP-N-acetylfucosamine:lipid II N-acetylfucosaminyltransferase [Flavobacterium solisilvae]|uniref:TDP-N-acetylfucosamine:lipid II N-acetylfucosaminyltransferase n=1 Tax=Flavobacterium solisilvae TaxID=1852019 RepID=A0ABX1QTZ1_9FLAO|nr:TDP-N-acetylfucosamine:lipid II N-acetylfucosaminyltransferase [Flavobacterium solisilvae]NMH25331.1 TDP-N-acetylfucosamine:lipid II N-acetylfucosaminyltransferase [Flavobacterium solisilvae]